MFREASTDSSMLSHSRSPSANRLPVSTVAPSRADACSKNHRDGYACRWDEAWVMGYDSVRRWVPDAAAKY